MSPDPLPEGVHTLRDMTTCLVSDSNDLFGKARLSEVGRILTAGFDLSICQSAFMFDLLRVSR